MLEVPAQNRGWKPVQRKDRGDVCSGISLKVFLTAFCMLSPVRGSHSIFWQLVFFVARLRYIEPVYLYNSIILELSTARLPSVCSSKHEAG